MNHHVTVKIPMDSAGLGCWVKGTPATHFLGHGLPQYPLACISLIQSAYAQIYKKKLK